MKPDRKLRSEVLRGSRLSVLQGPFQPKPFYDLGTVRDPVSCFTMKSVAKQHVRYG